MKPKITISALQRYECILCGRCCRRFYVLLRPAEIDRLAALDWDDEPDVPTDFVVKHQGFPYFRRRPDGACVFLGNDGACRMHKRFGFDKKALTCRGYPFNIVSTFPGEVSVVARMDCPAVLQNHGPLISKQRRDIEKLAQEMRFGEGFSPTQLNGMQRPAVEMLTEAARQLLQNENLNITDCMCRLLALIEKAQKLGARFLNDETTMREVLPSIIESTCKVLEDRERLPIGLTDRTQFRQWLCRYWRRDEEMLDESVKARIARAVNTAKAIAGFGNPSNFGQEHPDISCAKARMFKTAKTILEDDKIWEPYRRFLEVRMECYQFLGPAYYDVDFFTGIKALCLTYPLALAAAKYQAATENRTTLQKQDVMYAVAMLDHCHGRSPALQFKSCRYVEQAFAKMVRYQRLIYTLAKPW